MNKFTKTDRRDFLKKGAAGVATTAVASEVLAQEVTATSTEALAPAAPSATKANISSFRTQKWSDHFSDTNGGAIFVDMPSFALHFWNSDRSIYRLYPVAIPLKEEFARRGSTTIVRKKDGPSWSPTANMLKRMPDLPSYVGPGPENPLGTHALYLGWQYYIIHGNNDTRKIGRTASSGCIGLYNEHIEELFALAQVGCKVKVI